MTQHHRYPPSHCEKNVTIYEAQISLSNVSNYEEEDILPYMDAMESAASPTEVGCYENLNPDHEESFIKYEVILGGYCNVAVCFLGLVGNLLSLAVLFRKEMKQKNNTFNNLLIGLVTFDSLHLIFGIMESFRSSFSSFYPDILLLSFPWFHYPFYRITLVCSVYMMLAMAVERYLAVCFPHDYQGRSGQRNRAELCYIFPAMLVAAAISVPKFFEISAETSTFWDDNCTTTEHLEVVPTSLRLNRTYIIVYVNWIWTISTGIVPFVALLLLNVRIFRGLRDVQRKLGRHKRLANAENERMMRQQQQQQQQPTSTTVATSMTVVIEEGSAVTKNGDLKDLEGGGGGVVLVERGETIVRWKAGRGDPEEGVEETALINNNSNSRRQSRRTSVANLVGQRAKTAMQRKLQSAAQSREANMALILVSSVSMFLVCHLPRNFIVMFEAFTVNQQMSCRERHMLGMPIWYLYLPPIVRFLQVLNAAVNFPIYFLMGTAFRTAFYNMFRWRRGPG